MDDIPFFTSRDGMLEDQEQVKRFTRIAKEKGATQFEVAGSYVECTAGTRGYLRTDWEEENHMRAYLADPLIFPKPEHLRSSGW